MGCRVCDGIRGCKGAITGEDWGECVVGAVVCEKGDYANWEERQKRVRET